MITPKFVAAAVLAAGALFTAPAALSEPLPNPEPVPMPVPEQAVPDVTGGETRVEAPAVGFGESEMHVNQPAGPVNDAETSTTRSYVDPMEAGPNINGIPCEGAFESTVCYAEQAGDSPREVQPRSTLSSSP